MELERTTSAYFVFGTHNRLLWLQGYAPSRCGKPEPMGEWRPTFPEGLRHDQKQQRPRQHYRGEQWNQFQLQCLVGDRQTATLTGSAVQRVLHLFAFDGLS